MKNIAPVWRAHKSFAILLFVLASASLAHASSITYNYTGNPFTSVNGVYTTSDSVSGSFTLSSPLGVNLSFGDNPGGCGNCAGNVSSLVTGYSFSDGVNTWDPTNTATSGLYTGEFYIGTNAVGNITSWSVVLRGISGPFQFDPDYAEIATCGFPGCSEDQAQFLPTANTSASASVMNPGTWSETLNGFQGGSSFAPALLVYGPGVEGVNGVISGLGAQDYYQFQWAGGAFSATASIADQSLADTFLFSLGVSGTCSTVSQTLNSGDSFSGTISLANLAPGLYCIGLTSTTENDPGFTLTFNTLVQGQAQSEGLYLPEPTSLALLSIGLGMIGVLRFARRA